MGGEVVRALPRWRGFVERGALPGRTSWWKKADSHLSPYLLELG